MKLDFYNCPKPEELDPKILPSEPLFVSYTPDYALMVEILREYSKYSNILIIGHGGSINPAIGLCHALKDKATKNLYFLNTVDPDYIHELKQKLKPENTLVLATSKSGNNLTQIEALSQFLDFTIVCITGKNSSLRAMADKLKIKVVIHPPIGGRYTSFTEVNLLPLVLAGINAESVVNGAKEIFRLYEKENLAWQAASVFWQLEQQGIIDVFMPFYVHNLFPVSSLVVQLCHESFGKSGLGQTYFAHEAPESQHHTNQRFFGGRKNIAGFFVGVESYIHSGVAQYPPEIHSIQLKEYVLFDLNKIPLSKIMEFELLGTLEDARIQSIPTAHISLSNLSEREVGLFVGFWQLYALYSSVLRKVDPFDQPQVESSKNISFTKRLAFKGLL